MKLSKTQVEIMETAKSMINEAREFETFDEYLINTAWLIKENGWTVERYKKNFVKAEAIWNDLRKGVARVHCNSKSLKKLEEYGLVEILYDSTGENMGTDIIKVLNY